MQCVNLDQILDRGKNSYKDNWQNLNLDHGLDDSILSILNFQILIIGLSYESQITCPFSYKIHTDKLKDKGISCLLTIKLFRYIYLERENDHANEAKC